MKVEQKLEELGLVLPEPIKTPPGLVLPSRGCGCAAAGPTSQATAP
jgi:hypothetical protein